MDRQKDRNISGSMSYIRTKNSEPGASTTWSRADFLLRILSKGVLILEQLSTATQLKFNRNVGRTELKFTDCSHLKQFAVAELISRLNSGSSFKQATRNWSHRATSTVSFTSTSTSSSSCPTQQQVVSKSSCERTSASRVVLLHGESNCSCAEVEQTLIVTIVRTLPYMRWRPLASWPRKC
jgi:hypothetical protein